VEVSWFTDLGTKKISKITMEGTVTEYAMPAGSESSEEPRQIAAGPSETLWFLFGERGGVDKLTTTGVFTPVNEPTLGASATSLALGPDGNMWISGSNEVGGVTSYWIDRVTPSNTITKFGTSEKSQPHSITPGPESDLWFTSYGTGELGKITP
jgi:virginiamycin B lyase